jgi:hypothetical protein
LLEQRAVSDENYAPRIKALELLAGREAWADAATRQLLEQRAVSDTDNDTRIKALELLAGREAWISSWKDTVSRLKSQIASAATGDLRGWFATLWFESRNRLHGEVPDELAGVKRLVFTRDADGLGPYLDPLKAVSVEHLQKVRASARRAFTDTEFRGIVEEMNAELGWDIRKGKSA